MLIFELHKASISTQADWNADPLFGLRYRTYIFSVKFHRLGIYKSHSKGRVAVTLTLADFYTSTHRLAT